MQGVTSNVTTAETEPRCGTCGAPPADACGCAQLDARRIGHVVAGRYRIERRIGSGGMGVVYEARHLTLGRRFAIKMLLPRCSLDPLVVRRFEKEALAAGRLALQKRFGSMVTLSRGEIVEARMNENVVTTKTLDLNYYDEAAAFFR